MVAATAASLLGLGAVQSLAAIASAQTSAGATLPFTEYDAWTASTDGTVLRPSYYFGQLTDEAVGRQAVMLLGQGSGEYVQFTLTAPANAVDIHFSIPDSASGSGLTDNIDVYVNGSMYEPMTLTSQYSWLYGSYPFSNTPSDGLAHDFWDDARMMFSSTLPAGTVVKFQVDPGDNAPWYAINVADFYDVPAAISQPSGYLNAVTGFGADPTGQNDSTAALQNAINAASSSGQGLYIPAGTYLVSAPLDMKDNVTMEGAGDWYTTITGNDAELEGGSGTPVSGDNISNLAIFGTVNVRNDSDGEVNGVNDAWSNTTISNLWIQNTKVGMWINGPTNGLTIESCEIMDTTADGVNFDANQASIGVENSTVQNTFIRNSQDDGLAMWSYGTSDTNDTFTQDTVEVPGLANNFAIYGGSNDSITNNYGYGTVTQGGGIQIANRFSSTSLSGTITVSGNVLNSTGVMDPNWKFGVGAIWFYSDDSAITGATINLSNNTIENSPWEAYQFIGGGAISGVNITDDTVDNVGTYVFQAQTAATVSTSGLTVTGTVGSGYDEYNCEGSSFDVTGYTGTSECGFPAGEPLWLQPNVLTWNPSQGGTQTVTVTNVGSASATLGNITASSGFSVSNGCGPTLGSSSSYTLTVSFTSSASGLNSGTLSVPSSAPGSPATALLVGANGSGPPPPPPLSASPTSLTFANQQTGTTSATQAVTLDNPDSTSATISSISVTSGFAENNNCGSSLAGGASCTINVAFAPSSPGPQTGTLSITNSTTSEPISVSLSGTGVSAVSASPGSLSFPQQLEGTSSASEAVTVSNAGTSAATISSITTTGNFSQTNNCGSSLASGATCTVDVAFSPSATGLITGTLTVTNSSNPLTVALSGTGISSTTNLALTASISASSSYSGYPATNANDGNASTYWESQDGAGYPQWLQLNFGSVQALGSVTLELPPSSAWSTRTETLSVLGSDNGSSYTTVVPSAGYTFNPATGNTVGFNLPANTAYQYLELDFSGNTGWDAAQISEVEVFPGSVTTTTTTAAPTTNLALGATMTASGYTQDYVPSNANDGNTSTYWESTDNAFPQWLEVNFGSINTVGSMTIDLPPSSAWATRTQTITVDASTNGSTWTNLVPSSNYTFNPATGNTVSFSVPTSNVQYLRLTFTANTGWPAGQVSEWEIFS